MFVQFNQLAATLAICLLSVGCGSSTLDATTADGKKALLDAVNIALSKKDCKGALSQIQSVYNSLNTDNSIRMATASAYGCAATINFFVLAMNLTANLGSLGGSAFWEFLVTEFPSSSGDGRFEAGQLAQDALHSAIHPGAILLPEQKYNIDGFNPGSLLLSGRISDANAYLFFITLAEMGTVMNRYGSPYPNGKKSADLPWTTPTTVDADGCAYASAVVNFVDAIGGLADSTTGSMKTTLLALQSSFSAGIYQACDDACFTTCGLAHCTTCPLALRNRTSCTYLATDASSCAASGIVNFINNTPLLGWLTGP